MSDLIPFGSDPGVTDAITRTGLAPIGSTDQQSLWQRFLQALRNIWGNKPLEMSLRFAEAEVALRETENQINLLKAKQEYELAQAEIRRLDLESQANAAQANALAENIRAETRSIKAHARIQEVAAREVERRGLTLNQREQVFRDAVKKIRDAGGDVNVAGCLGDGSEREEDGIPPRG